MRLARRNFLQLTAAATLTTAAPGGAGAQGYPTRPVRIIVGFPAASATDIIARLVAQSLSDDLGQQFIVDDRPGAGSNIAAEVVVRATPDGYTLLAVTITNAVNETLYQDLNFDFARDIAPVAGTFRSPHVMVVNPSVAAKTLPEFIAYAKANPGKLNYASPGYGTAPNMAAELFKIMAGVDLVHVPYRASYLPDLLGGQVQLTFGPIVMLIENIKAGKLRALAVTSATRAPTLPDIPTMAEFVPGYEAYVWHGIGAPKDTPADVIEKLNTRVNAVLADPKLQARFAELGGSPLSGSSAEFGKFVAAEAEKWAKVARTANIKPE